MFQYIHYVQHVKMIKLAQQTSVGQVEFFHKISIIRNKNKSFEGLKLNIFEKIQCSITKARV